MYYLSFRSKNLWVGIRDRTISLVLWCKTSMKEIKIPICRAKTDFIGGLIFVGVKSSNRF